MNVETTWREITSWLQKNVTEDLKLRPPATEEDLAALERGIGLKLPDDLRRVYLLNNGQESYTLPGVFMGMTFIGPEEVLATWQSWKENEPFDPEIDEEYSAYPPKAVKAGYFRRARVPFAHDYGNNFIGLDLDPGPTGILGQVITYGRDELVAYCVASSFSQFLEWLLVQYRSGNYRVLEIENGGHQIVPATLEVEHFLDAVPALFGPTPPLKR